MCWTGTNHRGVQLNDAGQVVERWMQRYGQRCWLRQLTPDADRKQENRLLRVIARMDGTPFPTTTRLTLRWLRGQLPTDTTGCGESRSWTSEFASQPDGAGKSSEGAASSPPIRGNGGGDLRRDGADRNREAGQLV